MQTLDEEEGTLGACSHRQQRVETVGGEVVSVLPIAPSSVSSSYSSKRECTRER